MAIAIGYFVFVYRMIRGKVTLADGGRRYQGLFYVEKFVGSGLIVRGDARDGGIAADIEAGHGNCYKRCRSCSAQRPSMRM